MGPDTDHKAVTELPTGNSGDLSPVSVIPSE